MHATKLASGYHSLIVAVICGIKLEPSTRGILSSPIERQTVDQGVTSRKQGILPPHRDHR
jgi:hypothetical protein